MNVVVSFDGFAPYHSLGSRLPDAFGFVGWVDANQYLLGNVNGFG